MPCCARRVVSVAPIIEKAKPEEMPRNSAASGAASKYGRTLERILIVDRQRRMVGETPALVDRLAGRRGRHLGRRDLVVDAPADVLRIGAAAVRPPGVLLGVLVEAAKDVDEADLVEDACQPFALLGEEAGVLLVRAPVLEVDLLVRDVPVAAQDDLGVALAQALEMQHELLEEAELRRLAVRAGGARRHVKGNHPQLAEARLDVAAFGVELAAGEAALHLVGRSAAVERDAAVALLLRKRVAGLVELEAVELRVEVGLLALHLLQADDVGPLCGEPAEETFVCRRPDAVDVQGDDPQTSVHPLGKAATPPCAGWR